MVRLKDEAQKSYIENLEYFNSTMVRLKAGFRRSGSPAVGIFQFHYGSVKRRCEISYGG